MATARSKRRAVGLARPPFRSSRKVAGPPVRGRVRPLWSAAPSPYRRTTSLAPR
jgi:hypothetical protein